MSYSQYRVKIGNTTIKNTMIAPDSYKVKVVPKVVGTWKDANLVEHREVIGTKIEISFALRERFDSEQATIATIFSAYENLSVQYWDDISASYKTITCYMVPPIFATKRHGATLLYESTQITLTEY